MPMTSAEKMQAKRERDRLYDLGYALQPCLEGLTNDECLQWTEGVWKRQAELMPGARKSDPK